MLHSKWFKMMGLSAVFFASLSLHASDESAWTVSASLGEGYYASMMHHDGQYTLGRLTLGRELLSEGMLQVGLELGVQSGNRMRFDVPQETLDVLGGLPFTANLKPMPDALLTFNVCPFDAEWFASLKAGVAYRTLQWERESLNDVQEFDAELQAGLGYQIHENVSLTLHYQAVLGHQTTFILDEENLTGEVQHIPTQQAVLLGVLIRF